MVQKKQMVKEYARMWPRETFYQLGPNASGKSKNVLAMKSLPALNDTGVYELYRDGILYYVGQAGKLRSRLWAHAHSPEARYHNFWNHFSAFVITAPHLRNQIEGILIAAMPTANGAKPKLKRTKIPDSVSRMSRDIYQHQANPQMEFKKLTKHLQNVQQLLRQRKPR